MADRVRGERTRRTARSIRSLAVLLAALTAASCRRAPSRRAALDALERSPLSHDTATVYRRVWKDGPPWFSCAEVIAKFDGHADTAAVRDQVGNWRPLVVSGWLILRDTSAGVVVDPGWCSARLTDSGQVNARGWIEIERDSFPTGDARRGWTVPVGHQHLTVTERPERAGKDTARVEYIESVATNPSGAAMAVDRDSVHREALLVKSEAGWRVIRVRDASPDEGTP
jgi:hypothetical protein